MRPSLIGAITAWFQQRRSSSSEIRSVAHLLALFSLFWVVFFCILFPLIWPFQRSGFSSCASLCCPSIDPSGSLAWQALKVSVEGRWVADCRSASQCCLLLWVDRSRLCLGNTMSCARSRSAVVPTVSRKDVYLYGCYHTREKNRIYVKNYSSSDWFIFSTNHNTPLNC